MLFGQGQTLLTAAVAQLTDPPGRQYVAEGEVADDCEQVTVKLLRVFNGVPGAEAPGLGSASALPCAVQRAGEWEVRVARCSAVSADAQPPTPDQIEAKAEEGLNDLDALLQLTAGDLDMPCAGFQIASGGTSGPEGGIRASFVVVQIGLN